MEGLIRRCAGAGSVLWFLDADSEPRSGAETYNVSKGIRTWERLPCAGHLLWLPDCYC